MKDGIPYQVKRGAGDWGITAENKEKSQQTDLRNSKIAISLQCLRDTYQNLKIF